MLIAPSLPASLLGAHMLENFSASGLDQLLVNNDNEALHPHFNPAGLKK